MPESPENPESPPHLPLDEETLSPLDTALKLPTSPRSAQKFDPKTVSFTSPRIGLSTKSTLPTASRIVKDVTPPAKSILDSDKLWDATGLPVLATIREHFLHEGRISIDDALHLVASVTKILSKELNTVQVPAPVTICGDLHGQFYDAMKLFDIGGSPAQTRYLFLGDYVDRGCFSCECVFFLYAAKLAHPEMVFLLRGNHESRHMTEHFNFKDECIHKYNLDVYNAIMESFDALPLTAVVNNQFFCVHGGISPELTSLEELANLNRFREPPSDGLMCDLLWSDPIENYDNRVDVAQFLPNDTRQCSYFVPFKAVCNFLDKHDFLSVIRAHEACDQGFVMMRPHPQTHFPSLITIFSAPNYADVYKNRAAILRYDGDRMNIRQFRWVPHPYWLPNFLDVFSWSLPFVCEKISDMFFQILNLCSPDSDDDEDEDDRTIEAMYYELSKEVNLLQEISTEEIISDNADGPIIDTGKPVQTTSIPPESSTSTTSSQTETTSGAEATSTTNSEATSTASSSTDSTMNKVDQIRAKILAMGRLRRMFGTLRKEQDMVIQLKGLVPGHKLPRGLLLEGGGAIRHAISQFEKVKIADRMNETRPPFQTYDSMENFFKNNDLTEAMLGVIDEDSTAEQVPISDPSSTVPKRSASQSSIPQIDSSDDEEASIPIIDTVESSP